MMLKNVTLELSSKAFLDDSAEMMESVCRTMFRQWKNLTDLADCVSVMLWISDGSEILEYTGDLSQKFEWAYWCGCANPVPPTGNETEREKINTHKFPKKYRADAKPRPYSWLKELIAIVKRVGGEMTGKPVRVGAIFDNGPEFAKSAFKYKKHPEIAQGDTLFKGSFVTCNSTLHHDPQPYAAFPDGIPEGTPLGKFLGKQFRILAEDMDYDYIWLSNGMGFGTETWGIKGALFDKTAFYPEKADAATETMLQFWREFTKYWPADKIETRGSNYSAGHELSTDAAPLKEIYTEYKIIPPVNSPWAALNSNSGLELAAWMSHVAVPVTDRFPFRFYAHDPWFLNSPWLDRYEREPWDIYLPLSVCRLTAEGQVQTPNSISILTVDDTLGQMPDQVPDEVIPHLKEALRHAPDQCGPLVWVYPLFEYSDMVRGDNRRPDVVFNEDSFIGEAIQQGLPLNTVISTDNFRGLMDKNSEQFNQSVIIAPVSAYTSVEKFIARGGEVIFYGSLAHAPNALLDTLGLKNDRAISGKVTINYQEDPDSCLHGDPASTSCVHPQFSAGGLTEIADGNSSLKILATGSREDVEGNRIIAMVRHLSRAQKVGFVRGLLPSPERISPGHRGFDYADKSASYPVEKLMRNTLAEFGWSIRYQTYQVTNPFPRLTLSRNDNAFYFTVFAPNTGVEMRVSTPFGAPVLAEMETLVSVDEAAWHPGRTWHKECRCFIRQKGESMISAKTLWAAYKGYRARRAYHNLRNADVVFFPPANCGDRFEVVHLDSPNDLGHLLSKEPLKPAWITDQRGSYVKIRNVTGSLYFTW